MGIVCKMDQIQKFGPAVSFHTELFKYLGKLGRKFAEAMLELFTHFS
jgi:hypothetical protein